MILARQLFDRIRRQPCVDPSVRVYAIGDIHGRADLLRDLMGQINRDIKGRIRASTHLVFLGDLIDRGPSSREVLHLVRNLQKRTGRVVALCGNHEDLLLKSAAGNATVQQVWLDNGGDATLASFGIRPLDFARLDPASRARALRRSVGQGTLAWLASLPASYRSGDYLFCHAGVRPGVPLGQQRREDLLWIRQEFLRSRRRHGAVIVHGHSESYEVEIKRNRINVDTAAYISDDLTAVGLQGQERWFLSTLRDPQIDACATADGEPTLATAPKRGG